eukprot:scaffold151218_cov18-Tisochrysis_lutea.AAC.2
MFRGCLNASLTQIDCQQFDKQDLTSCAEARLPVGRGRGRGLLATAPQPPLSPSFPFSFPLFPRLYMGKNTGPKWDHATIVEQKQAQPRVSGVRIGGNCWVFCPLLGRGITFYQLTT